MSTKKAAAPLKKAQIPSKTSETVLVTHALNMLRMFVPDGMFWRNNAGMIPTMTGGMVRLAPAGTADIVGIVGPLGIFVALEAKVPSRRNNVSKLQKDWLKKIKDLGGYSGVFCTIDECLEHVLKAKEMSAQKMKGIFDTTG